MGMFDYTPIDIFKYEKRDITHHMMYGLHLGSKVKECFAYLCDKIGVKDVPKDWTRTKWSEGKNYNWLIIKRDAVTFAIRQYGEHYTIFSKREKSGDEYRAKYAIFTFHTDRDKLPKGERDDREHTEDIAKYIDTLLEMAAEDKLYALWNSISFKREAHIDVKCVWSGGDDDVEDIDLFNFACEEIFQKTLELFSVNDMLERVKKVKVGEMFGEYEVIEVRKKVENEYFHGVGIKWKNKREESWQDVYSLTRWHFAALFPQRWNLSK